MWFVRNSILCDNSRGHVCQHASLSDKQQSTPTNLEYGLWLLTVIQLFHYQKSCMPSTITGNHRQAGLWLPE